MRILVCVKSVPRGDGVPLDLERGTLCRSRAAQTINPADCAALEQAFRLKERHGAVVTVLSVGPSSVEQVLREICALPVDDVILVSDPLYAGSDTLATARILAKASVFLGGFDLILLGRRAIDGETGHVGPELAALMAITACVTNITGDCSLDCSPGRRSILCSRLLEDTLQALRVPLPAVLTLCGGEYALRPPGIAGMRSAKPVTLLTNAALALAPESVGLAGSPTAVAGTRPVRKNRRPFRLIHSVEEGAGSILEALDREVGHPARLHAKSTSNSPFTAQTHGRGPHTPAQNKSSSKPLWRQGFEDQSSLKQEGAFWVVSLADDAPGQKAARELTAAARSMGVIPLLITLRGKDDVACARLLAERAAQENPSVILLPATIRGRNVAPYCAALLQTGLTADCTELALDRQGRLRQVRPAFGGGLMAEIYCRTRPQMATVRPGVFTADGCGENPYAAPLPATRILDATSGATGSEILAVSSLGTVSLREAKVILAGGRGIGSKEGFARIKWLAGMIGAAVGASRSAVDAGFAPYIRQIGQTGATVRPDVYIAFAISGSVQHLAGMRDSGLVIAVNADPKAAIFSHADIGIIARWEDVAAALERKLENSPRR